MSFRCVTSHLFPVIEKQTADDLKISDMLGKQWKIGASVNPVTSEFKH